MRTIHLLFLLTLLLTACQETAERADAYGHFEATETLVSAEANGKLLLFDVEEGKKLGLGEVVGLIDTMPLHLQLQQVKARITALGGKTQSAKPQVDVLQKQKSNLLREEKRVQALLKDSAATQKQLDDIQGQIEVVDRQIKATESQTSTLNQGILAEVAPLQAQMDIINDQINRCFIKNPVEGTVLIKLTEPGEIAAMGKPLYTIAPLEEMELRAYVSGTQLPHLSLGQEVEVLVDQDEKTNRGLKGKISWIASEAEFTPKTIQTKEERVNLVYAIKVKVVNDGRLKIGMPAEVNLGIPSTEASQKDAADE